MRASWVVTRVLAFMGLASVVFGQSPCTPNSQPANVVSRLPQPTGAFQVGRMAYQVLGTHQSMIYIWYPAEKSGSTKTESYIPGWKRAHETMAEPTQRLFREAYCAFDQGNIAANAVEDAPIVRTQDPFPLILFAPGLGITSFAYTAQLEELASHGYVVATAEYEPAVPFVVFPDRWASTYDSARWNALSKLPEDSEELTQAEKEQIEAAAQAFRTVLDVLVRVVPSTRLAGRVDFNRVGALGHSFGGMTVLRAVQIDPRFRAALAEDSLGQGVRAFAKAGQHRGGRVGLFFRQVRPGQQAELEELFTELPNGTMLATPSSPGFVHMSFSDLLLLRAGADAGSRATALRHLEVVRALIRAYFAEALRGEKVYPSELAENGYPELTVRVSKK